MGYGLMAMGERNGFEVSMIIASKRLEPKAYSPIPTWLIILIRANQTHGLRLDQVGPRHRLAHTSWHKPKQRAQLNL